MTIGELRAALEIKQEIDRKKDRLNDLRATGGVGSPVGEPVTGGNPIGVEQIIVELDEEIQGLWRELKVEKVVVQRLIDKIDFEEDVQKQLMQLRYVECYPWEYIWRRLSYSRSHTFLMHTNILAMLGLDKT